MRIRPQPLSETMYQKAVTWKSMLSSAEKQKCNRLAGTIESRGLTPEVVSTLRDLGLSKNGGLDQWLELESLPPAKLQKVLGQVLSFLQVPVDIRVSSWQKRAVGDKQFYVDFKGLPDTLKKALKGLKAKPTRVLIKMAESVGANEASSFGDGSRGWMALINLETGDFPEPMTSGWGQIIPDRNTKPLPFNSACVVGQESSKGKTVSYIKMHPDNIAQVFPMPELELSLSEKKALYMIYAYNPGGRKKYFPEYGLGEFGPNNQYVKSLVSKGLVQVKGSGVQITTVGKTEALKLKETILTMRDLKVAGDVFFDQLSSEHQHAVKTLAKVWSQYPNSADIQVDPRTRAVIVKFEDTFPAFLKSTELFALYGYCEQVTITKNAFVCTLKGSHEPVASRRKWGSR